MIQGPSPLKCATWSLCFFLEELHQLQQAQGYHSLFFSFSPLEHGHEFVGRHEIEQNNG